ncbi:hypothetical protein [Amycolatopsis sp. SID8362]|uniref:hypothetical protein n=1 Tax=Amycolatopsis sp. SID8362 TaxID=2690346 RepID=UPI00137119D5|nr:hypothetical protein [Amycolatopsis sp. SID8362]NBH04287.1 hypothetical protein [Amycolatopsis sp. SID8362]NED40986.1 hypothetical protein [Amycolatopsis sp. SID8362]
MDEVDTLLRSGNYGYSYQFLECLCGTYLAQVGEGTFDLAGLIEGVRQVDTIMAESLGEALEQLVDPAEAMKSVGDLGPDDLFRRQTELAQNALPSEAAAAAPGGPGDASGALEDPSGGPEELDDWYEFLRGNQVGWDGTAKGWQKFRADFVGGAADAGVPNSAEMLMAEAESSSDPAALLTSYGVRVGSATTTSADYSDAGLGSGEPAMPIAQETVAGFAQALAADGIDVASTDPAVLNEIIRSAAAAALQQQR